MVNNYLMGVIMKNTDQEFPHMGERLKQLMDDSILSVSALAKDLHYKDRHQVYYLYKKADFKFSELINVCIFLDLTLTEFVGPSIMKMLEETEVTALQQLEKRLTNLEVYVRNIEKRIETS
jgi:hypothetical protein